MKKIYVILLVLLLFINSVVEVIYSVFMLGICLIRYTGTITVTNEFVVIVIIGGVLITTTDRFLYKRKKLMLYQIKNIRVSRKA